MWCQRRYGPLSCVSTKRWGGSQASMRVVHRTGIPRQRSRYSIRVPAPITIGAGVITEKRSHAGVIASRLVASPKKVKTSAMGRATHCSRSMR